MTDSPAPPAVRLGATCPSSMPSGRLRAMATAADRFGLDDLWLWEDCFAEGGLTAASAALAWTERVRVGLGLAPAPLRNVALLAMEVATVARLFPGRFVAGVGHGVQSWMAQAGVRPASPMTLLTEYIEALQRLLAGEQVSVSGRYVSLDKVRLESPPEVVPPVMSGGYGDKTLALAARSAAGTLLSGGIPLAAVRNAGEIVARERADAATTVPGAHELVAQPVLAVGEGAQERIALSLDLWQLTPDPAGAVTGSAAEVAGVIEVLRDAGATAVTFVPAVDEPVEELVRFLGEEVAPLVR